MSAMRHVAGKINLSDWGFVENESDGKRIEKIVREALREAFEDDPPYALFGWGKKLLGIEVCLPLAKDDYVWAIDFEELVENSLLCDDPDRCLKTARKLRKLADTVESMAAEGWQSEREIAQSVAVEQQIAADPFRSRDDPYWMTHIPGPGPERPAVTEQEAREAIGKLNAKPASS
jgi:hypothetical protein